MIQINKTASNVHFNDAEMDREINFSTTLISKLSNPFTKQPMKSLSLLSLFSK